MDFATLIEALERARQTGDKSGVKEALAQLETDELAPQVGESRRFHIRGTPPDQVHITFMPGPQPPPSYPADLPWVADATVSVAPLGPRGEVAALWPGGDTAATLEAVLQQSLAAGWREPPGLRFPTASGAQVRHLERGALRRQLTAVVGARVGMVQLLQGPRASSPVAPATASAG